MQYICSSRRLKAFLSSSGIPLSNIFQARSKTWNQTTHLGTSATLKHTDPRKQHVTDCPIIISPSLFLLLSQTQLISYKGRRHQSCPSPTSDITSLLQQVLPYQRWGCLFPLHSKIHCAGSQPLQTPPNPKLTPCAT